MYLPFEEATVRELDHRHADGIDVRLLWNPDGNRVWVAVEDHRLGLSETFPVSGADALQAFHHPYAYAGNLRPAREPAHTHEL